MDGWDYVHLLTEAIEKTLKLFCLGTRLGVEVSYDIEAHSVILVFTPVDDEDGKALLAAVPVGTPTVFTEFVVASAEKFGESESGTVRALAKEVTDTVMLELDPFGGDPPDNHIIN